MSSAEILHRPFRAWKIRLKNTSKKPGAGVPGREGAPLSRVGVKGGPGEGTGVRVAYFISSHGFGHATRACAVMDAVWQRSPEVEFEVFSAVPAWLFEESLPRPVGHHPAATDVGLVQVDALEEDLAATARALRSFIPFREELVHELRDRVTRTGCTLVVCDVAPLGLAVARAAGLPSLLVENFTWDWIYRSYGDREPELATAADYLAEVFAGAGQRVQTEPHCQDVDGAVRVAPVARRPRQDRRRTREQLAVPDAAEVVMVTMGGIEWDYTRLEARLAQLGNRQPWLVIPGGSETLRRHRRVVRLPHRSDFYHPDLIAAADAVIGKLGYSTLAEVYRAGLPFGYVPRTGFPESPILEAWARAHLPHLRIEAESFAAGTWLDQLEPLLALPRRPGPAPGGAGDVARLVVELIS